MTTSSQTTTTLLQKVFILAAGIPADTRLAATLAQQVTQDGHWGSVVPVVENYLKAQAAAIGTTNLLKQMAWQGLALRLDDAQAQAIAQHLDSGAWTWASLVAMVVTDLGGSLGDALAHKAEAAQAFTDALEVQHKGALYFGGPQLLANAHALLLGVNADAATVHEAAGSLRALVDLLDGDGLAMTAVDGYLAGAQAVVDSDGDGRADPGETLLQTDGAGRLSVGSGAPGAGLVAWGGVDLLTGCDFQGVLTAPLGATVINPLTTVIDALLRGGHVPSAQAGSTLVETVFGLPARMNLLNDELLAVLADPLASAADKADALQAQALALQLLNLTTFGGAHLAAVGGIDAPAAARLMNDALARAVAAGGPLDPGDPSVLQDILADALQALTGIPPTAQQAQVGAQIAQLLAALNGRGGEAPSIYDLAKVASASQCEVLDAVRDALAAGEGMQGVLDAYTGTRLDAVILRAHVGEILPGVPVREVVLPTQTASIRSVADDRGTDSTADDIAVTRGGTTSDATPLVTGSLSAPLQAGQLVAIYGGPAGDQYLGAAIVAGQSWTFTPGSPLTGWHELVARVVGFHGEGPAGSGYALHFNQAPVIVSDGGAASAAVSLAENGMAVTTVAATDADGNGISYAIAGGADAALFAIDATTGALSFLGAPDYENPLDAGGDNVYDVVVQASDGTLADTQAIQVTVTNANEAPVITSHGGGASAGASIAENTTAVGTVAATDVDGNGLSYSIVGGADAARFTVDGSTGVLAFVTAPDFESPQDAGGNNVYDVTVQVSDGTLTDTQAIAVTVTNANEAPAITSNGGGASAGVSVAENSTAVATVAATDADGNSLTFSIAGGADAARFTIDAATGALSFSTAPDHENPLDAGGNNVYDVVVQVSDGTLANTQAIAVTVTNANEAPVITSNGGGASAGVSIAENTTAVGTVAATDVDGNGLGYSIVGGADAARFTIDGSTGALAFVTAPDFENPQDAGGNNVYDVTVQVSDGTLTDTQAMAVTVTNANDAPAITSNGGGATAAVSVAENATAVTSVAATDADGNTVSYSIVGGTDAALFTIDGSTGALRFITAPDHETPLGGGTTNVYDVVVQASDGTLADTQTITVTVTNVNETPAITSNGGGASASVSVAENSTAVMTVAASDVDGDTVSYSIVGGADAALFTIDGSTGALSFITAPDHETPLGGGTTNVYDVVVQASDGTLADTQAITVTVTDVNEAPAITSDGGGATGAVSVAENATAVTTVAATDVDGNSVSYSIVGGADAARFTIDAMTGALSFLAAPDREDPQDAGSDNVYDVTVQVSDGTLTDTQAIAVTVTNVNETPAITSNGGGASASVSVAENSTAVMTVAAPDVDGDTVSYSIVGGIDAALFTIDGSTGALSFITAPDHETPLGGGTTNVYDLVVQASDGTLSDTQAIVVTVTNVNETPAITSNGGGATAAVSVAENATAVTTVAATDVDGDAVSYSIVGGADAALFTIDGSTGALSFIAARDHESPQDAGGDNVYDVTVQVSDGTLSDTQAIAVTVTNVNEAPVITSNGGGATAAVSVAENTTAVASVAATDVDGNSVSYSIVGGADAARFTINSTTGALAFLAAPDYENPQDAGANNVYDVTVQVSDGTLTDTQAIAVTVTNVAENAVPTSNGENLYYFGTSSTTVNVLAAAFFWNDTDADSPRSGWSLTNVVDNAATGNAALSGGNVQISGFATSMTNGALTYQINDGHGATSSAASVNVQRISGSSLTGSSGSDIIIGDQSNSCTISGGDGQDWLLGGTNADSISGGEGNDYLSGGDNSDTLDGGAGNDIIVGDNGNDTIIGGTGLDDLTGGGGADVFRFIEGGSGVAPTAVNFGNGNAAQVDNGDTIAFGNGVDIVRDFSPGNDDLDLGSSSGPTSLNGGSNSSSLSASANYTIRGTYGTGTQVFTVNSSGADLLVIQGDSSFSPNTWVSGGETDFILLIGVTSITSSDII